MKTRRNENKKKCKNEEIKYSNGFPTNKTGVFPAWGKKILSP